MVPDSRIALQPGASSRMVTIRSCESSNKRKKKARREERSYTRQDVYESETEWHKAAESVCASFDLFAAFRSCRRLAWLISRLFTATALSTDWLPGLEDELHSAWCDCGAVARACAQHCWCKGTLRLSRDQRTFLDHCSSSLRWNGSQRVDEFSFVTRTKWFYRRCIITYVRRSNKRRFNIKKRITDFRTWYYFYKKFVYIHTYTFL